MELELKLGLKTMTGSGIPSFFYHPVTRGLPHVNFTFDFTVVLPGPFFLLSCQFVFTCLLLLCWDALESLLYLCM
jgi:hypothetical protein